MSEAVAVYVRHRMRLHWYHAVGSILFDAIDDNTLQSYAEQCATVVQGMSAKRRKQAYATKLLILQYYNEQAFAKRDEVASSSFTKANMLKSKLRRKQTVSRSGSIQGSEHN